MEPVEIPAGRLHLRPWTQYDEDVLFEGCNDPLIQRWTRVPSPYPRELATARVASAAAGWAAGDDLSWAVCDGATGQVLAAIDLRHLSDDTWDVGFLCYAWARGQGVTSRRAAEKAGVVFEGVLRGRHALREGVHPDTWVGSLVPSDLMEG